MCLCVWEGEKMKLEEAGMCASKCWCVIAKKAMLGEKDKKMKTKAEKIGRRKLSLCGVKDKAERVISKVEQV